MIETLKSYVVLLFVPYISQLSYILCIIPLDLYLISMYILQHTTSWGSSVAVKVRTSLDRTMESCHLGHSRIEGNIIVIWNVHRETQRVSVTNYYRAQYLQLYEYVSITTFKILRILEFSQIRLMLNPKLLYKICCLLFHTYVYVYIFLLLYFVSQRKCACFRKQLTLLV